MKIQAIVLVCLLCLLAAGGASAQASANYALNWSVVGSGGCEMTSASYAMQSTVGQTAIGTLGDGYTIEAGYWLGSRAVNQRSAAMLTAMAWSRQQMQ